MADEIREWKPKYPALTGLANILRQGVSGANQLLPGSEVVYDLMGLPDLATTLERLGYGQRLTSGRGQTLRMLPETVGAVTVVPDAAPLARAGAKLASRGALGASDAAVRAITGNPAATAMRVIEETRMPVPAAVIKPKGGNWLSGSVETSVEPLKGEVADEEGLVRALKRLGVTDEDMPFRIEEYRAQDPERAVNNWLDKKLAKYIRNEMATPEDPVRALAERGVLHVEPRGGAVRAHANRTILGMPTEPTATAPLARVWEDAADAAVLGGPYRNHVKFGDPDPEAYLRELGGEYAVRNPDALAYAVQPNFDDLGFGHLVDELRNAINPESGLPAELLWKYSDLNKVSVPQAVERVAKINEWRAAQKALADAARARNPATQVFKEYPEQGFSWVELRKPEGAEDAKALEDALKYEGETMGHCVGGYCPDVEAGRSRIFSLRSAKGEPHVTIEVQPGRKITEADLPDEVRDVLADEYGDASREEFEAAVARAAADPKVRAQIQGDWMNDKIIQIKGKANRAPNEEYLPFVQDFVRSQKWGKVGDLQNTGFVPSVKPGMKINMFGSENLEVPDYMMPDEFKKFIREGFRDKAKPESIETYLRGVFGPDYTPPPAEGFASGGLVSYDYDPARVAALADQLQAELFGG